MSNIKEKLTYIKQHLTFGRVFAYYGLPWKGDFTHQYKCDMHGDGKDHNPSARYYHDQQVIKCYACEEGNNGGDVCWFIKKRERFNSYTKVVLFVRAKFGVDMDEQDLPKRMMIEVPQGSLKEEVKNQLYALVNDAFFKIKDRAVSPEHQQQLSNAKQQVWDHAQKLEGLTVPYLEYSTNLRQWCEWALKVAEVLDRILSDPANPPRDGIVGSGGTT